MIVWRRKFINKSTSQRNNVMWNVVILSDSERNIWMMYRCGVRWNTSFMFILTKAPCFLYHARTDITSNFKKKRNCHVSDKFSSMNSAFIWIFSILVVGAAASCCVLIFEKLERPHTTNTLHIFRFSSTFIIYHNFSISQIHKR